ncbi:LacI family transcriptional regulator [Bifidobacterium aquikefiri]|uniref:LacI family transcriptional regulator n=2 Tax=Bifidobacterium aquikefiri TaxID=1653207 RepID=A0A261G6V8_9BIFI|nr:LacI family transcriptional regulator [Bifidobacterium aquikefiri]
MAGKHARWASMQDVAKEAGVSPQTVSRVSNGSEAVKPDTRDRVQQAMQKLGYRPNFAGRALKHGRFKNVGVAMFNMNTYGNMSLLQGITDCAVSHGYATTVLTMDPHEGHPLQHAVEQMKNLPVDGVILVLEQRVSDFAGFIPPKDLPVILITEGPADHCPTIDDDQYGCASTATDYLLSKGHKTVYHIAGPQHSQAAVSRQRGWKDALLQQGKSVPDVIQGDWNADSGFEAGRRLAQDPQCTAIFASNDQMAYGAMQGIINAGKRVPEDISIVGVDDSLRGLVPNLTLSTMRLHFSEIATTAFSMVLQACEGNSPEVGVKKVIAAELVERASVRDVN